jgi:lipopolysaccharide biosynthesis glycosyltransferase
MNIVVSTDKNYLFQCIVLIFSVISSNKHNNLRFFVLSEDLSESDKQFIIAHFKNINIVISFVAINSRQIKTANFSEADYISIASYYRLLIPVLLPLEINKVLYLDCDMLVIGDLGELYKTDISNHSAAVSIDFHANDIRYYNRLDLIWSHDYFNAGMLLINVDYWRKNNISEKTLVFLDKNKTICTQHDQDALNKVLTGTVKYVSAKFNYIDSYFEGYDSLLIRKELLPDVIQSAETIVTLHYTGSEKPWHIECLHPYRYLWLDYYKKIIGKDCQRSNRYKGLTHLKKILRKILGKINLVHYPYIKPLKEIHYVENSY